MNNRLFENILTEAFADDYAEVGRTRTVAKDYLRQNKVNKSLNLKQRKEKVAEIKQAIIEAGFKVLKVDETLTAQRDHGSDRNRIIFSIDSGYKGANITLTAKYEDYHDEWTVKINYDGSSPDKNRDRAMFYAKLADLEDLLEDDNNVINLAIKKAMQSFDNNQYFGSRTRSGPERAFDDSVRKAKRSWDEENLKPGDMIYWTDAKGNQQSGRYIEDSDKPNMVLINTANGRMMAIAKNKIEAQSRPDDLDFDFVSAKQSVSKAEKEWRDLY